MKKLTNNTISVLLLLFVVLVFGCKEDEITNISAETLTIDKSVDVALDSGQTFQLKAVITPDNAGNKAVFWKSQETRIATVSDEGLIAAIRPGTTTITATAYSNTTIRDEITIKVNGIPDDVVSGVSGTYTGELSIPILGKTHSETPLTLERDGLYAVRLIVDVDLTSANMGILPINIPTSVDRDGDGFRVFTEEPKEVGLPSDYGPISVDGTVDADGNIELTISVAAGPLATYSGQNVVNMADLVTGTYVGNVVAGVPVGTDVEVVITQDENKKFKLSIDDTVATYRFVTEIELHVLRSGDDFTISSAPGGSATLAGNMTTPVEITSGTITASGAIDFKIKINALSNLSPAPPTDTATYSGQKLEKLANKVAGTYEGVVTLNSQPISAADAEITLTVVDRTTVRWTTETEITLPQEYGGKSTFTVTEKNDFELTVSGGSGTYTLAGSGNTSLGPINVSSNSSDGTTIRLTMTSDQLPLPIIYEGQKQ